MPKFGCSDDEYEDAFQCNQQEGLYSIADGATEASFSKEWANLVVNAYCEGKFLTPRSFERNLNKIQAAWSDEISNRPLPWYAEEKVKSGAFCSFLGIKFKEPDPLFHWVALVNGDCCLFHIRDDQLISAFPFQKPDDFNNHPTLLSSNPHNNLPITSLVTIKRGVCRRGDTLFLMTDALACWFLRSAKRSQKVIQYLNKVDQDEHFTRLIHQERTDKDDNQFSWMKNDDVTFLRIKVGDTN